MGYRRVPNILTLTEFEGYEGLVVRMKAITYGKVRRMAALSEDDSSEATEEMAATFQEHLVSWNVEDERGLPIEPTEENINAQDFEFIMDIIGGWLDQVTGPTPELGKGSTSGETFPGRPLTMEAL